MSNGDDDDNHTIARNQVLVPPDTSLTIGEVTAFGQRVHTAHNDSTDNGVKAAANAAIDTLNALIAATRAI